jgi:N6-L-threonylcarbamoyladenine synthase
VAVTAGPGLIGGVLAGVMFAKGLAAGRGLPLWGVNHLAGHALSPRLVEAVGFPYLMLLVSGGHCQFLLVEGPDRFRRLGGTIDDAVGEAFDKVAKLLGLGQPGGPAVERVAAAGATGRFALPRPLMEREDCDLSFSGLKTAVRRARDRIVEAEGGLRRQDVADLAAGFQAAVAEVLAAKTTRALAVSGAATLAVAGGVAANGAIRGALGAVAEAPARVSWRRRWRSAPTTARSSPGRRRSAWRWGGPTTLASPRDRAGRSTPLRRRCSAAGARGAKA